MPYKRREPCPVEWMNKTRWEGHHSICQTLRDMYHMTDSDEIRIKLRLAMSMAKAMHERLKKYKLREEAANGMPK